MPALRAEEIVVSFGGIRAVNGASIEVADGEIVGLIGTNGAGKSTLMNAIGGFCPSEGTVELFGEKAARSASARARQGLGRSFQAATLFPELTVRETVLVAFEARKRTSLLSTALFLPPAIRQERRYRSEADELIDFLGLGRYADMYIADLSTGTRRIVELAGLLALDARLLCLDEPTAGVAQRETEAFGPLIKEIRRELSASMLVIEHDMPLIMSISDRVYCLELGQVISEGVPVRGAQRPGGDRQLPRHRRAGHRPQRRRRRGHRDLGRAGRLTVRGDGLTDLALAGGHIGTVGAGQHRVGVGEHAQGVGVGGDRPHVQE